MISLTQFADVTGARQSIRFQYIYCQNVNCVIKLTAYGYKNLVWFFSENINDGRRPNLARGAKLILVREISRTEGLSSEHSRLRLFWGTSRLTQKNSCYIKYRLFRLLGTS